MANAGARVGGVATPQQRLGGGWAWAVGRRCPAARTWYPRRATPPRAAGCYRGGAAAGTRPTAAAGSRRPRRGRRSRARPSGT
eukprot:3952410-Prymnesium_polylepis.1